MTQEMYFLSIGGLGLVVFLFALTLKKKTNNNFSQNAEPSVFTVQEDKVNYGIFFRSIFKRVEVAISCYGGGEYITQWFERAQRSFLIRLLNKRHYQKYIETDGAMETEEERMNNRGELAGIYVRVLQVPIYFKKVCKHSEHTITNSFVERVVSVQEVCDHVNTTMEYSKIYFVNGTVKKLKTKGGKLYYKHVIEEFVKNKSIDVNELTGE
jgi:hypothetical protein